MPPKDHDGGPFGYNGATGEFIYCECSRCRNAREDARVKELMSVAGHDYCDLEFTCTCELCEEALIVHQHSLQEDNRRWQTRHRLWNRPLLAVEQLSREASLFLVTREL